MLSKSHQTKNSYNKLCRKDSTLRQCMSHKMVSNGWLVKWQTKLLTSHIAMKIKLWRCVQWTLEWAAPENKTAGSEDNSNKQVIHICWKKFQMILGSNVKPSYFPQLFHILRPPQSKDCLATRVSPICEGNSNEILRHCNIMLFLYHWPATT